MAQVVRGRRELSTWHNRSRVGVAREGNLFDSFNSKEVDAFADSIVAELVERHPPRAEGAAGRKEVARLRRAFGRIFSRIDSFARTHDLNLYRKARLANRIQWALKEAGYREDFIEATTHEVATHVALAGSRGRDKRVR